MCYTDDTVIRREQFQSQHIRKKPQLFLTKKKPPYPTLVIRTKPTPLKRVKSKKRISTILDLLRVSLNFRSDASTLSSVDCEGQNKFDVFHLRNNSPKMNYLQKIAPEI
jgi:hypothetical protein